MKSNNIIWCTDDSCHKKFNPKVSGAGWIAYYTKTNNRTTGNFFKISADAGSYRSAQLGLCAIHHLVTVLYMFYNIKHWHTPVNCDNQGAIIMSKRNLRRIRPGPSCVYILSNIRNTWN